MFDNYEDAFNFSLEYSFQDEKSFVKLDGDSITSAVSENDSFNSNFKGPANTDLAKFRKMIQSNELDSIQTLITNPRYLINSCETPVLLMEGPRYNAFHIACKSNRFEVLKLLLGLLKNKEYLKTLFHLDDDIAIQDRIVHIVDLYLNTPDKGVSVCLCARLEAEQSSMRIRELIESLLLLPHSCTIRRCISPANSPPTNALRFC